MKTVCFSQTLVYTYGSTLRHHKNKNITTRQLTDKCLLFYIKTMYCANMKFGVFGEVTWLHGATYQKTLNFKNMYWFAHKNNFVRNSSLKFSVCSSLYSWMRRYVGDLTPSEAYLVVDSIALFMWLLIILDKGGSKWPANWEQNRAVLNVEWITKK
jgi:hypothetical protein